MKYITYISLISRLIFLFLVFIVIRNPDDYLKVPILNGLGSILSGLIGLWILFISHRVKFKWQNIQTLKVYLSESIPLFLGNIAGKIKILSNKAILGAFVGMESVALYDIADKIKDVFLSFLQLISQVLFPNVSKNKNFYLIQRSIRIVFISGLIIYIFCSIILKTVLPIYFTEYKNVFDIFAILGILIFLQSTSYLIVTSVLVVNNLKKEYTINLYLCMLIYLSFIVGLYIIKNLNVYTVSISLVVSVAVEILINYLICRKNNLLHWILK